VTATATRVALSIWLVYLAVADLRRGEVTNWATVPLLLAATAWQTLAGGWPLALMLALVLAGSQWAVFAVPSLGLMVLCAWAAAPLEPALSLSKGLDVAVWVWALAYLLWQIGVIGGADAKVVMALTAAFPDGRLAWLLLLCWLGLSVVYLLHRHGRRAPQALLQALVLSGVEGTQGLVRFRVLEGVGSRCPALPAVALAGLIYVWFYL
jgi:Flp pilus assembly protein protease CpaA